MMPSRVSSTNSVSDGGLPPQPRPRRLLSADGRRRRNARNRQRQKRKRQALRGNRGVSNSSDSNMPSTISLSISPSEVKDAKELGAVVNDQRSIPSDVNAALDDILKVLDGDKMGNSSPTAVVKTVPDETNHDRTAKQGTAGVARQKSPVEHEKVYPTVPDLDSVAAFQLTREPSRSSKRTSSHKNSVLQCEEEHSLVELSGNEKSSRVVPEPVQKDRTARAKDPGVCRVDRPFDFGRSTQDGNVKSNKKVAKRRRIDVEYSFSELKTVAGPIMTSLQDTGRSKQDAKEQRDGELKISDDGEVDNPLGAVMRSRFLDDILDLEKGLDFNLPEMDQTHIACGGQDKVSVDIYPIQTDHNEAEKTDKDVMGYDTEQATGKNIASAGEEQSRKSGPRHERYLQEDETLIRMKNAAVDDVTKIVLEGTTRTEELGNATVNDVTNVTSQGTMQSEELANEAGIDMTKTPSQGKTQSEELENKAAGTGAQRTTTKTPDKFGTHPEPSNRDKGSSAGRRRCGTTSVSAALRFARKQNMLQEAHEVKIVSLGSEDAHVQKPLCSSSTPKSRKRKKKKKKRTQPPDARQMINEQQYNESVFVGFENESREGGIQAEYDRNDDCVLPPPSLLEGAVDMRDPGLFSCTTKKPCVEDDVIHGISHSRRKDDEGLLNEAQDNRGKSTELGTDRALSKQGQGAERDGSALHAAPTAGIEMDDETYDENDVHVSAALHVPEKRQSEPRAVKKKGNPLQELFVKHGRTTSLDKHANGDHRPAHSNSLVPTVPAAMNVSNGDLGEPLRHSTRMLNDSRNDFSFRNWNPGSENKKGVLDFEGKLKFLDDVVTLMTETTVELQFFCKELFRVKSRIGDESPS